MGCSVNKIKKIPNQIIENPITFVCQEEEKSQKAHLPDHYSVAFFRPKFIINNVPKFSYKVPLDIQKNPIIRRRKAPKMLDQT